MASRWVKRVGFGVVAVLAAAGGVTAWQWKAIQAHMTADKFRTAKSPEERTAVAEQLLNSGEPGIARLVDTFRTGTADECNAVADAVISHLKDTPAGDPKCAAVCRPFLAACDSFNESGRDAAIELVPLFRRCGEPDAEERCRGIVKAGLAGSNKASAVRFAVALGMKAEVVPLLNDPRAEVRRAAMAAVGPAGVGTPAVDTEELFRWLNDPDAEVRLLCEAALSTRGVEPDHIDAGRMLTHPEASERLKLLLELRQNRAAFRDPGPWLERLGRDPDPAVRAGAARVGYESKLEFGGWLDRLASDPDATVRRIASYHKQRAEELRQVGARE
jgi:HEAT repeat protein